MKVVFWKASVCLLVQVTQLFEELIKLIKEDVPKMSQKAYLKLNQS